MDDLVKRLRAEVVLEQLPPFTVIIDGKETVCDGGKVVQSRNPDGREAADRIEALTERADALALQADEWEGKYAIVSEQNAKLSAERDRLAAIIREAEWIVEHAGYPVVAEEMRRALLPQQKEIGDGQG